jgi:hypothetical protein
MRNIARRRSIIPHIHNLLDFRFKVVHNHLHLVVYSVRSDPTKLNLTRLLQAGFFHFPART